MGTNRVASDIDLMLYGITRRELIQLLGRFEESTIPYMMDLIPYDPDNQKINSHVELYGKEFYLREESSIKSSKE